MYRKLNLILTCILLYFIKLYFDPYLIQKKFKPTLEEYSAIRYSENELSVTGTQLPYRVGRVMIMNPTRTVKGSISPTAPILPARIDPAWFQLPRHIRAEKPEEIETLIVAHYHSSASSYQKSEKKSREVVQMKVTLNVYHVKQKYLIGSGVIEGLHIPSKEASKEYLDAVILSAQNLPIAEWVEAMPVKEAS